MDSASDAPKTHYTPQGDVYLGSEYIDVPPVQDDHSDGNLKSRKFIVGMTLILASTAFTFMGMMSILEWMGYTGTIGAVYLGVNVYQKKMML